MARPIFRIKVLLCVGLALIAFPSPSHAELPAPSVLVKGLVESAHGNDLGGIITTCDLVRIASNKRHAHSPEAFVALLKSIDPEEIRFDEASGAVGDERILIRMTAPRRLEFGLQKQKTESGKPGFHYRVVHVGP